MSRIANSSLLSPKLPAAECFDKHVFFWSFLRRIPYDYIKGGCDDVLVGAVGVILGVTLVPAGLSQFCKITLNPVQ